MPRPPSIKVQAAQWNKLNPTAKVTLAFNGGNDSALQKTVAGFTAGNYPDVAYEYGSSAAQLGRQPKLVDLTSKVSAPGFDWSRLLPVRAAGGHGQRQGRRRPGPGRQPQPRLQQEDVRSGRDRTADLVVDLAGLPYRRGQS